MASSTLDREVEVVKAPKADAPKVTVTDAAKSEDRDKVHGDGRTGESRAWDARAQVD